MSNLYSGKGDKGRTELFDGQKVSKSSDVIEALGCLDELTSLLGIVRARSDAEIAEKILAVQENLFLIQAVIAGSPKEFSDDKVKKMEDEIDAIENLLPDIKTFIIPGGDEESAWLDFARAVSRRTERELLRYREAGGGVPPPALVYLNRLSSFFYSLARLTSHKKALIEKAPRY
ncbi:MAG: cob(I)yrinic acid a,c-diamide adenosyltransferase [Patescibacteria group bacterium]